MVDVKPRWNTFSAFSIRISTTTLQNFISMIAATVSSSGRSRVGPKHTPKLLMVILFFSDLVAMLKMRANKP